MKKFLSRVICILVLCFITLLSGCTTETVEPVNNLTIEACMQKNNIKVSEEGKRLTYYYKNSDEIAVYFTKNWSNGTISCRRYFVDVEKYNMYKNVIKDAKYDDKNLSIYIEEYLTVQDMEAYWKQIENNDIYTIVK